MTKQPFMNDGLSHRVILLVGPARRIKAGVVNN